MAGGAINDMSTDFFGRAEQHSWFPPLDERRAKLSGSPLQMSQSSPVSVIPACDAWLPTPLVSTIWQLPPSPPVLPCYGIPSRQINPISANQAEDAAQRAMRMVYLQQLQDLADVATAAEKADAGQRAAALVERDEWQSAEVAVMIRRAQAQQWKATGLTSILNPDDLKGKVIPSGLSDTSYLGRPSSRSAAWRAQAQAEDVLMRAEAGVKAARAAQAQAQAHAQAHETQHSLAQAWTQARENAKAEARKASLEALLDAAVEGQAEAEALLAARR